MKPDDRAAGDLACVHFNSDPEFEPMLQAARTLATALAAKPTAAASAAARLRGLGVAELMPLWQEEGQAAHHLFLLARALVPAGVDVVWSGLADAPRALLGTALPEGIVALPDSAAQVHHAWWPLADEPLPAHVLWPSASGRGLHGLPVAPTECTRPIGMPQGRLLRWSADVLDPATAPTVADLPRGAWTAFVQAQSALLLGLIDGLAQQLVVEAFAYARQRVSAGKPIAQHQAVALRLADLALTQQTLSLVLQCAVLPVAPGEASAAPAANPSLVAESSMRIARDSLQVAAAHGYVDGLLFKRGYALSRLLVSAWSALCRSRAPAQPAGATTSPVADLAEALS
ncbi:MAG: hypothetical protein ING89_13530 [Rubrivivax sp.]|nr:hypothetical protein [Rubrivivax sp.]